MSLPWFLTHDNPEQLYTTGTFLVLDFETDEQEKGSPLHEPNDIVLACWQVCKPDGTVLKKAHTWGGIYEQQELLDDIASVDFIVAQNLKFELGWLKRCGLDLHDVLGYDTMLAAWVLDGNRKGKGFSRSLGALARRYGLKGKLDIVSKLIGLGIPTRAIHSGWMQDYCHQDVEATKQVFLRQQADITAACQWHLVHVRNLTCSVLADMEFEGLHLDPVRVEAEYLRATETKERLGAELATMTGGINLNSPKQLSAYLYGTLGMPEARDHKGKPFRTPGDEPTANAKVLALLKPKTEAQRLFLEKYKEYNKQTSLLEKNLEYFKLTCDQRGGIFYGQFQQNVVQTHRLASNGIPILFEGLKKTKSVQMQNIPREYKLLFWSGDEDWEVFEADSSQVEFRVAVDMAEDQVGMHEVETGVDIHSFTASELTKAGEPTTRQDAKAKTFRPLYGGGSGSEALKAYCAYFKDKYKGISKMQSDWAHTCADKKQYTTPYGMTFYFPNCKIQRSGWITDTTSIYNYPVQGFATGEIIPIALVHFWHRARGKKIKLFSTIHDSIASKVHKDSIEEARAIAKQALTTDVYEFLARVYKYEMKVPLGLGMKNSRNWTDTKQELKFDIWPDGRIEDRT